LRGIMLGDGAAEQKFERRGEPAAGIWQAAIPRLKISMMIGMTNLAFNECFDFFPFATPPQSLRKRLFRHQTLFDGAAGSRRSKGGWPRPGEPARHVPCRVS
jgi:hypothetical protein